MQTNKQMQTLICLFTTAIETQYQNVYLGFKPSLELENRINTLLQSYWFAAWLKCVPKNNGRFANDYNDL